MKKVLFIHFSQSGQLTDILHQFALPFKEVDLDFINFKPKSEFPFPWNPDSFYSAMPETVTEVPTELHPIAFKHQKYDLIVLGYQPWFLSPSLPTSSLLQHESFQKIVANTPVFTIIGARNMWLNAQKSIVNHIQNAGGHLIGNVALVDKSPNLLSAVSIAHWMMTGKKEKKWGIFPKPGISDTDISNASTFGNLLYEALENNNFNDLQHQVIKNGGAEIKTNILFIEGRAKKIFQIWAKVILKKDQASRNFWVRFFRGYLNFALFCVAPIVLTIYNLLVRPLSIKQIKRDKEKYQYLGISTH